MPDVFVAEKKAVKKRGEKTKTSTNLSPSVRLAKDKQHHKLKGHNHNPLSSFCYFPDKVNFVNEDPEEVIVLLLRKHPITNIKWIIVAFLMFVAPTFLSVFPIVEGLSASYKLIAVLSWYLITIAFVFEKFLSWFFNVNIITDERIIEVDFINLVYREITDANIDQIQDVTVQMAGAVRTLFNYGDIVVQTAAEIPQITFDAVPKPDDVSRILRESRIEEEQEKLEGRVR